MSKTLKAERTLREIELKKPKKVVTKKQQLQHQLHKDSDYVILERPERDDALFLQSNIRM